MNASTKVKISDQEIIAWLKEMDTYVDPIRSRKGRWIGWYAAWRNARAYRARSKIAAIRKAIQGGP